LPSFNDPEPTLGTGRIATYEERVNLVRAADRVAMRCECGSTHFYVVQVQEYKNQGYGTAQIQGLSMQPETAYICVCGLPVAINDTSGGKATGNRARFLQSIEYGVKDRHKLSLQAIAKGCVSIQEHKNLQLQLEALKVTVKLITDHLAEEDEEEVEVHDDDEATDKSARPLTNTRLLQHSTPPRASLTS
jgi:hypothetical protein